MTESVLNFGRVAARGALAGLVALAAPAGLTAQTQLGIELGAEPAPLALDLIAGPGEAAGRIDLGDSFGERPVVLQFWATWCPLCEALEPKMVAAHEEFGDRVDFYAVAVAVGQNPKRIARHLEDHPLPFPMLWDENGEATRRFQAPTTSYVVILDADGRVAYTGVDSDQDIRGALTSIVGTAPTGG
ncbi:MAG TPA: TlpA disulfide reductase family protein [Gemmatimonadota bacterium]|nr:TlpA disulfide reductase family protein [Gemmatimonadota bacterium]